MEWIFYIKFFLILSAISLFLMAIFEKYEIGDETWDGWFLFFYRRHFLSYFRDFHDFIYNIISSVIPISAHPEHNNSTTRIICFLLGCVCLFVALSVL